MNFEKSQFRTIPNLKCSGSAVLQVYYGTEVKAVNKSRLCIALGHKRVFQCTIVLGTY